MDFFIVYCWSSLKVLFWSSAAWKFYFVLLQNMIDQRDENSSQRRHKFKSLVQVFFFIFLQ